MRCRHRNVDEYHPDSRHANYAKVEHIECIRCGHWMPLGPARDTPETAIEVRAAEIAVLACDLGEDPDDYMTIGEFNGWEIHRLPYSVGGIYDDRAAGYLARCIVEHKS